MFKGFLFFNLAQRKFETNMLFTPALNKYEKVFQNVSKKMLGSDTYFFLINTHPSGRRHSLIFSSLKQFPTREDIIPLAYSPTLF